MCLSGRLDARLYRVGDVCCSANLICEGKVGALTSPNASRVPSLALRIAASHDAWNSLHWDSGHGSPSSPMRMSTCVAVSTRVGFSVARAINSLLPT